MEKSLAGKLQHSCEQLIEHLSVLVERAPPDALLGQISTPKPTKNQIRSWLHHELSRVFPKPSDLIKGMTLDVQFRDVTYETLTEEGFGEKLRQAYPHVDWDKPFAEFDSAREQDSAETVRREYLNPKRFPLTSQTGLDLNDQTLIDKRNLAELQQEIERGRSLSPRQQAALEELKEKRKLWQSARPMRLDSRGRNVAGNGESTEAWD